MVDEAWHKKNCMGVRSWTSCFDGLTDSEYCECEQGRALKNASDARTSRMIRQAFSVLVTVTIFMAVLATALVVCSRIVQ